MSEENVEIGLAAIDAWNAATAAATLRVIATG